MDTQLVVDPESGLRLGWLHDDREVAALQRITTLLDNILKRYGEYEESGFYIELPEWRDLITAACEAREVIKD